MTHPIDPCLHGYPYHGLECQKCHDLYGRPNGCGPQGVPIKPPDFSFGDACGEHDLLYGRGGDKRARWYADSLMYHARMKSKTAAAWMKYRRAPWYKKPLLEAKAHGLELASGLYFTAVRLFGWTRFGKGKG